MKKRILLLLIVIAAAAGIVLLISSGPPEETEKLRPVYHFTPEKNWMNDPNGLVYLNGEYHLFYQHNPKGNSWGHMSWGHAVSRDLVQWQHLPVALHEHGPFFYPTMAWSGSAVMDRDLTSGLCGNADEPPMVAVYTSWTLLNQTQGIAFSCDRGRSFTRYNGNPVIDIGSWSFRDPKVFRYDPAGKWIMVVALPSKRKVRFYSSPDLKKWEHMSDFGPAGFPEGVWECPDLFQLPVENRKGEKKWVLVTSLNPDGPGPDMQYFIGHFDGRRFTNENREALTLRLDYGFDYYAAVSWNNVPKNDGRRIMTGWASNWNYAMDMPTYPWKGAMSLPREISLRDYPEGTRIAQSPVRELARLRKNRRSFSNIRVEEKNTALSDRGISGNSMEIVLEFTDIAAEEFGIRVLTGEKNCTEIAYNSVKKFLFLDRSRSGDSSFDRDFRDMSRSEAPLDLKGGNLRLRIFIDRSIVEVFAQDGYRVITDRVFPGSHDLGLELFAKKGSVNVHSIEVYAIERE